VVHIHRIRGIGGSERHVLTLLPALAAEGIEPVFLGLDDPDWPVEPFYRELAVESVRLECPRDLDPRLVRRVRRELGRLRPDVVHTHLVTPTTARSERRGVPVARRSTTTTVPARAPVRRAHPDAPDA
jgi:hypothetical protein